MLMPLLDIATPQPSFSNNQCSIRFQSLHHVSFVSTYQNSTSWGYFRLPRKPNTIINPGSLQMCPGRHMTKAVATLEPRSSHKDNDNTNQDLLAPQQLGFDSTANMPGTEEQTPIEDEKEILRRNRISKANKGKTPWNKGVRHSPETRQLIRERTKIAMRSAKVKMKLIKAIHNQSNETRLKIRVGVQNTWDRRREKRAMQELCHVEWLNLIADASRKGLCGQEELQWNSYKIMDEQLRMEFRDSVEQRKVSRPRGCRRAPKSFEQRKKISEAIAAKWADPAYRDRVHSGIAKYRGNNPGTRKPTWGMVEKGPKKIKSLEKKEDSNGVSANVSRIRSPRPKLKTSNTPIYKDPQARSKLEMIKSIRAERAGADTKIREAVARAYLLIGEAQRAAEALEVAAVKSPVAQASLVETRRLIAEAIRYIKSIEMVNTESPEAGSDKDVKGVSEIQQRGVNGSEVGARKFGFSKLDVQDEDGTSGDEHLLVNGTEHVDVSSSSSLSDDLGLQIKKEVEADDGRKMTSEKGETQGKGRRWVCGKLVEEE